MSGSLSLPFSRASRRGIVAGCALAGALLFAAWRWADDQGWLSVSTPTAPSVMAQTDKSGKPPVKPVSDTASLPPAEKTSELSDQISLAYAGNLGVVTELQAQIQELKLKVELEEQQQKLSKLQNPVPTVVASPVSSELLASLTPPQSSLPHTAPPLSPSPSVAQSGQTSGRVRLISVQTSGSARSAAIATSVGAIVVRQGDSFQGTTITRIADDMVLLASGRRITWE